MTKYKVADEDEIGEGDRMLVEVNGTDVAVFNIEGTYYAYANWCGHQGGPCCEGTVSGTTNARFDRETLETAITWEREGEVISCPWHGWEYDLTSGACLSNRRYQLIQYDVVESGGCLFVEK